MSSSPVESQAFWWTLCIAGLSDESPASAPTPFMPSEMCKFKVDGDRQVQRLQSCLNVLHVTHACKRKSCTQSTTSGSIHICLTCAVACWLHRAGALLLFTYYLHNGVCEKHFLRLESNRPNRAAKRESQGHRIMQASLAHGSLPAVKARQCSVSPSLRRSPTALASGACSLAQRSPAAALRLPSSRQCISPAQPLGPPSLGASRSRRQRGSTAVTAASVDFKDRAVAALPYLVPLFDGLRYGAPIESCMAPHLRCVRLQQGTLGGTYCDVLRTRPTRIWRMWQAELALSACCPDAQASLRWRRTRSSSTCWRHWTRCLDSTPAYPSPR